MSAWPFIENIAILVCACAMAWLWDSIWPFLLLLFVNHQVRP